MFIILTYFCAIQNHDSCEGVRCRQSLQTSLILELLDHILISYYSLLRLYRLCSDVEVSKQVVELEGVNRLIRLCKDERERNHSDGVLVACLVSTTFCIHINFTYQNYSIYLKNVRDLCRAARNSKTPHMFHII